jgi:hypothetical protein
MHFNFQVQNYQKVCSFTYHGRQYPVFTLHAELCDAGSDLLSCIYLLFGIKVCDAERMTLLMYFRMKKPEKLR